MGTPESDHAAREAQNFRVLFQVAPVVPAGFVILAVRVIVAALRAPEFIPAEQHRHAARDQHS